MTTSYLTTAQVEKLLAPIHRDRVSQAQGFSHVQAYDIRAALTRVFGFARWSAETLAMEPCYERSENGRHWCAYRAQVRLTVCAPDGTVLASYTDWAVGDSSNQPKQGDCHDMAIKTAESQALKRAATNLGDCFGLSLYNGGSLSRIVGRTLVPGIGEVEKVEKPDVDEHITAPLAVEDEPAPPVPEPRSTSARPASSAAPVPVKDTVAELRARTAAIQARAGKPS